MLLLHGDSGEVRCDRSSHRKCAELTLELDKEPILWKGLTLPYEH
jgi:hypothetical protein